MAAAGEFATVFLETSLGTRFIVSFPASATTVADLKRQVTAEHAACFPKTGPIAVKSVQVKHDGSLFHLTDSMVVERAFRWIQGPWYLLVEARELGSHSLAREDADCGSSDDSEQNSGDPVISNSKHNMSPAVSNGCGNLAIGNGVSDTPLSKQLEEPHQDVKRAFDQLKDENTLPRETSDLYLAAGGSDTSSMDQQDQRHEGVEKHASGQSEDSNVMTMFQESSDIDLTARRVPQAKNQLDKSHEDVEHVLSQCKDGSVRTMLQGSSSLDAVAGEAETPSMNHQDNCYQGVKHASGQLRNGTVKAIFQENSDLDAAVGGGETPPLNQLDKLYESVKHALGQCEDGNVKTMPEGCSDFDVAASEIETPQMNQLDKSHEDIRYASGQLEDGTVNVMLKSSDFDESAAVKDNGPMRGRQKDVTAEPRGTEHHRKENRNDKSITGNYDTNISSLANSTININLAEEKSSGTEQENFNSSPLAYNQGNGSHGMEEKPSRDQKEPWTSEMCHGESSNSVSDIPPLVHSVDRDSSSNREANTHRNVEQEPWVSGLCSGESSFKETDVPHCIKSMEEGNKTPASNDQFLKKRKYEGATASISAEHKPRFKTRQMRVLAVRKVPMSKAAKIFGVRC